MFCDDCKVAMTVVKSNIIKTAFKCPSCGAEDEVPTVIGDLEGNSNGSK
jgi:DNA-directed RNA polymerase subunit M/transcription elongation factor TFIIS